MLSYIKTLSVKLLMYGLLHGLAMWFNSMTCPFSEERQLNYGMHLNEIEDVMQIKSGVLTRVNQVRCPDSFHAAV